MTRPTNRPPSHGPQGPSGPAATALLDQLHAAATEATQAVHTLDAIEADSTLTTGRLPGWVTQQLVAVRAGITAGTTRYCPHIDAHHPRVIHAAVWAPGLIACTSCAPQLAPDPAEDTTCDRCRTTTTQMSACTVADGPLLLGFGLCQPCHDVISRDRTTRPNRATRRTRQPRTARHSA